MSLYWFLALSKDRKLSCHALPVGIPISYKQNSLQMHSPPDDIRYIPGVSQQMICTRKNLFLSLLGRWGVKGKWKTKLPIHIWKPGPWTNSVQITCQLVIVYEIRNNTFQLKHFSQGKFSWQSEDIGVRFAVAVRKRSIKAARLHFSGLCARNSVWHLVCAHW